MIKTIDTYLFILINSGLAHGFLDPLMVFITAKSYYLLLPVLIWLFIKDPRKAAIASAIALFALTIADSSVHVMKILTEQPRPFTVMQDVRLLVGKGGSSSMPSGHAANAFAVAGTLAIFFGGIARAILLLGALLVGISRIYVGVHYPSDVLVGMVMGGAIAFLSVRMYAWSTAKVKEGSYLPVLSAFIAFLSLFRVYFILTGNIDLSTDEAQYWDWSRHLDLSYYSKGPMIAYLIAGGRLLFGNTVLGVRIGAVLLSASSSLILFLLFKRIYDEKTGFWAAVVFQIVPLFSVFGVLMTIDSPFVFFWIAALYLMWLISEKPESRGGKVSLWILLGAVAGMGLLTKYTMAFFLGCAFLYLLSDPGLRKMLATPYPYMGLFMALLLFSPVITWNAMNGWVTLKHTVGQAHLGDGFRIAPEYFFDFIGSQLGVVTPVLFILMAISLVKMRDGLRGKFMLWFSAPVFFFFLLKSLQGKVQGNWAMTAYVTGVGTFSYFFLRGFGVLRKSTRAFVVVALCLSFAATAFVYYPRILGLPPSMDPSRKLRGWEELGRKVSEIASEMSTKGDYFIFSDRYQITSELAFYVKGNPVTYCANTGRRMNQYDLWPGFHYLKGFNAVYVTQDKTIHDSLLNAFEGCEGKEVEIHERGEKLHTFSIFKCYNFKGLKKQEVFSY